MKEKIRRRISGAKSKPLVLYWNSYLRPAADEKNQKTAISQLPAGSIFDYILAETSRVVYRDGRRKAKVSR